MTRKGIPQPTFCPEAYFHALSQAPPLPPLYASHDTPDVPKQALFLDAFAACLPSNPRGEVYAVALRTPPFERLTLYIARSDDDHVPQEIQDHCASIANALCEISACVAASGGGFPVDALAELAHKLRLRICRHTLAKISKRSEKVTAETWLAFQQKARPVAIRFCSLPAYENLIQSVDDVRRAVATGDTEKILNCCRELNIQAKGDSEKDLLIYLDRLLDSEKFSLHQYIGKLLKVFRSVERLMRTAASSKFHLLFETMPNLVYVPSPPRAISYDISKFSENELLGLIVSDSDVVSYQGHPHGECVLAAYFLSHGMNDVFEYIGVSHASCFGCRIYFEALSLRFSKILFESPINADWFTLGTHDKAYPWYVRPMLPSHLKEIDKAIGVFMQGETRAELKARIQLA